MSIYTVHQPLLRKAQSAPDTDGFVFVRDGFHFWAFLLGPFWMAWRRLWIVLVLYLVTTASIEVALHFAGANEFVKFVAALSLALLVGLEAGSLQRWTLARRGFREMGIVVGDDSESAEARFFSRWLDRAPRTNPTPSYSAPPAAMGGDFSNGIIGSFPEPDIRR